MSHKSDHEIFNFSVAATCSPTDITLSGADGAPPCMIGFSTFYVKEGPTNQTNQTNQRHAWILRALVASGKDETMGDCQHGPD